MKSAAKLALPLLWLLLFSPLYAQVTEVRAWTDIAFDEMGACNELDFTASHTLTLVELNTQWDKNYPLNVGGQIRTCGIGVVMESCEGSLDGPQFKGRVAGCKTRQHAVKCNKDYRARTTGSIGNIYIEVDGDAHNSGCDFHPCMIAFQGQSAQPFETAWIACAFRLSTEE